VWTQKVLHHHRRRAAAESGTYHLVAREPAVISASPEEKTSEERQLQPQPNEREMGGPVCVNTLLVHMEAAVNIKQLEDFFVFEHNSNMEVKKRKTKVEPVLPVYLYIQHV